MVQRLENTPRNKTFACLWFKGLTILTELSTIQYEMLDLCVKNNLSQQQSRAGKCLPASVTWNLARRIS